MRKDPWLMTVSEVVVPIDMEAEYRRICKSRKTPDTTAYTATTSTAPAAKATTIPPSSPATKKTVKNIVLVPHTQDQKNGEVGR